MARTPARSWAERLVHLTAPLVPGPQRDDWRREWLAELAACDDEAGRRGTSTLRRVLGAPVDAFWMRQRQIADLRGADDLRHGWRQLAGQAGFAATAVGVLAIGMAASLVAFSVVSQVVFHPLPYPDPGSIVTVWERPAGAPVLSDVSPGNFLDWRARATTVAQLAAAEPYSFDYTGGDRPEALRAANVTEGFFDVFGLNPLAGRFFLAEDHAKGTRSVVLSERLWRQRFGSDAMLVGRAIPLNGAAYTVVGIVGDDFQPNLLEDTPGEIGLWVAKAIEEFELRQRASGYWQVVGRLAAGRTIADAQPEFDAIAGALEAEYPRTNAGARIGVRTLREHLVGDVRPAVTLFAAAVIAVLLIACVNVTNLLLARGATRQQELAIRTALGASRHRLVMQLIAESLLLSSIAAALAVAVAVAGTRLLAIYGPREVLWIETLHVDGRAVLFAAALAIGVAIAAGIVPALRLTGRGLQAAGPRTMTADRSQRRLRSTLVAIEVALALVIVSGCALLVRSFVNLLQVETGFRSRGVVALQVFAWDRHPSPADRRAYFERVAQAVAALPAVDAVGAVSAMPFIESNIDVRGLFGIAGRPAPAPGEEPRASFNVATPGYFEVMRIPLRRGRFFDFRDGSEAPRVAVISDALASRFWRDADPLGSRLTLRYGGQPLEVEVVGVVGATRHEALDEQPRLEVLLPHTQAPTGSMTVVARTALDPATLVELAKAAIWAIDPLQTFYQTATLDDLVDRTLVTRRFTLVVLMAFAGVALLLAAAGLYGVLTAIVSQYRREIGVRLALGARWLDIVWLVVTRGLAVAGLGVAVGLAGALAASRALSGFLFAVAPSDPLSIGGAAVLMIVVSALACYLPARRAAAASPAEILRTE